MSWCFLILPLLCTALPLIRLVLDQLGQNWTFQWYQEEQWRDGEGSCDPVQVSRWKAPQETLHRWEFSLLGCLIVTLSPGAPQFQPFLNSSSTPGLCELHRGRLTVTLIILPRTSCIPFSSHPLLCSEKGILLAPAQLMSCSALPGGTPGTKPSTSKESRKSQINIQHGSLHHSPYIILCGTCTVPMATSILHPTPLFLLFEAPRISGARATAQSYFVLISLKNRYKKKRRKCSKVWFS